MAQTCELAEYVTEQYLISARRGSYNGVSGIAALLHGPIKEGLRDALTAAIQAEKLECVWDVNPHIKRFWAHPIPKQLELLAKAKPDSFCIYPTEKHLMEMVADGEMRDRPFSRRLLLGEPQLEFATFELQVLSRYAHDPRFILNFEDYAGNISISNEHYESNKTRERDRVGLQSFGLAIDQAQIPHIVVFLRYLDNLSGEHQHYWNSFLTDRVPMCHEYYQSSILGEFWENRCIRNAIGQEISVINAMANANFGKELFRQELSREIPIDISAFSVPSSENFSRMVLAWDKLLSDNLRSDFFPSDIARSNKTLNKKGDVHIQPKGTINILSEWMTRQCENEEDKRLVEDVVTMLKKIRDLRQRPAHSFSKNQFSEDFYKKRRALLCQIFEGLRALRVFFSALPNSVSVAVPEWLNSNEIEVF